MKKLPKSLRDLLDQGDTDLGEFIIPEDSQLPPFTADMLDDWDEPKTPTKPICAHYTPRSGKPVLMCLTDMQCEFLSPPRVSLRFEGPHGGIMRLDLDVEDLVRMSTEATALLVENDPDDIQGLA